MPNPVTPIIGAKTLGPWKPTFGVTPGPAGDATAPFALGTTLTTDGSGELCKFARASGTIASAATAGIAADGTTTTAVAGNTWTNGTGVQLVTGDYAFFTADAATLPLT